MIRTGPKRLNAAGRQADLTRLPGAAVIGAGPHLAGDDRKQLTAGNYERSNRRVGHVRADRVPTGAPIVRAQDSLPAKQVGVPGVPIRHNRSDRGNTGRSGGRLPVQPVVGPEQGVLGGGQHAYAGRIEGDRQDRPDQRVRRLLFPIETAVARREQTRVGAKQQVCRIQGVDGYCQGAPDGPHGAPP